MKLTVPTNWQDDLLAKIKKPYVDTVYGKLDKDFVGGGRASCVIKKVSRGAAEEHIKEAHSCGLKFFYLLNASCMGNRELTKPGQKEAHKLLDWLARANVDGVVVSNPYLFRKIKALYPGFKTSVSCFANVNSVPKAKFWEDLGADVITLSLGEINRDFRLLKKIRENVRCDLQLIVNEDCLQHCPRYFYHNNTSSHGSQSVTRPGEYLFDYCRLMCRYHMMLDPANFLRTAWIRPEDLSIYESIGIDRFKIVDRTMHSDALSMIVEAYSMRSYKGNLYDLFANPSKSLWIKNPSFWHKFEYFFHPFAINIFKLKKMSALVKDIKVVIDNSKLDGFMGFFLQHDCRYDSCETCGYCGKKAREAVSIDEEARQRLIKEYKVFLDSIISGEIFNY